ncbi:MAG: cobalamin-dependent protein [Chloroflexota bacterium]|nr:cobalamin-dependent protein [Chloroflexota bacterium]
MPVPNEEISRTIDARRAVLADETVARHYEAQPELAIRYGPAGRAKCLQDANYHLSYLSQAIAVAAPELFADYIGWARAMLAGRNVPSTDLMANLVHLRDALQQVLPDDMHGTTLQYVDVALEGARAVTPSPPSFIPLAERHAELAQQYLDALLSMDRHSASTLIMNAVQSGVGVKELYIHVFQPVQQEIGRLWQLNQVSVAQEHYCTAVTQLVMSQLYPYILTGRTAGRTLVAACVAEDLHELGVRMVADLFELEGWKTIYLGANTPTSSIVKTVVDQKADVLALSATMTYHVQPVAEVIAVVRSSEARHVRILVGGYPFNRAPDLWKKIGADGYAPDASSAIAVANELAGLPGG